MKCIKILTLGGLITATGAVSAEVYHPHSYATTSITWQTVPDVDAKCRHEYRKLGQRSKDGHYFLACAVRTPNQCLIITGESTTHEILGHEMRHCYDGAFHD